MASVTHARKVAHALLGECRRRDARARDLMRSASGMEALSARERAFAQRLVLGVTACSGVLDQLIDRHLRTGAHLEPRVRDALRLSAYELCWMSTPAPVAVDQGVGLVRGVRRQASGLANAVLRRLAEEDAPARAHALERLASDHGGASIADPSLDDLSLVSGCPAWLMGRIASDRGVPAAVSTALALCDAPSVYVAPNLTTCSVGQAWERLMAAGAKPRPTDLETAFELRAPAALAASGLVERAEVVVADLAAQRVAAMVAPAPACRVLEVGQGRATKTILLENAALAAGGPATIVGIDSEAFKVDLARARMAAAGLADHVSCLTLDGRRLSGDGLPPELAAPFDVVLVDAPCSGTGTLRRHPEIAWSLDPFSLDPARGLPETQLALLAAAASRVTVGGLLAYSTCSVIHAEDEGVVDRFLARPEGACFTWERTLLTEMVPQGQDGHFLALLRRGR